MNHAALIFSHSIPSRLQYIVDFLSKYYELDFKITPDETSFINSEIPCKINYSFHRLSADEIFIHPHALLFETFIRPVKVECFDSDGTSPHKVFFKALGDTGFDIFAACFYLISRYEEYLPHKKDEYERFDHRQSLAFKEGFLHLPLVNIWLEDFRRILANKNPAFEKVNRKFSFLPTYDIDMAWSYRNKGFKRNAAALLKLFFTARFGKMMQRIRVLRRKRSDPFDSYEWMDQLHEHHNMHPVYFMLVAKHKGKYDKNIDVEDHEFKSLIKNLASRYQLGLHPSWSSNEFPQLLFKEKQWLEEVSRKTINDSRQHYIRFELPGTYRRLLNAGIQNDFSMGYGSVNGFRASITSPYFWYDLKNEEITHLLVHPFCFMDANAFYEQQLSPMQALGELKDYLRIIKSVNGNMITIWHNSFLGNHDEFEGWRDVYREFLEELT